MENPRYHIQVIDGVLCKECTDCHRVLDLHKCYYYKKINGKWSKWCKECYQKHNRMNREKRKEKQEKERQERAEKMREAVLQVTVPAVRRAVKNERLRKIDEALEKVAAMKMEKQMQGALIRPRIKVEPMRSTRALPPISDEPNDEPCRHCKSYSHTSDRKLCKGGYCLKHHRGVKAESTCALWNPNIKKEFVL